MKGTEVFKQTISSYLTKRANEDELFAESYKKENKSIDECINYIFGEVQKSGCNGFADEEIYGMAVHYYDEDDIKDVKENSCDVVVNHKVELTKEDKISIQKKATQDYYEQELKRLKGIARVPKKKIVESEQQLDLFSMM